MKCHFFVEIYAPEGLRGIDRTIGSCAIPLDPWRSGCNGKVILRVPRNSEVAWAMDPSDDDIMVASGSIAGTAVDAETKLRSLSECLTQAGFPHAIDVDGPEGHLHTSMEHAWPPGRVP